MFVLQYTLIVCVAVKTVGYLSRNSGGKMLRFETKSIIHRIEM